MNGSTGLPSISTFMDVKMWVSCSGRLAGKAPGPRLRLIGTPSGSPSERVRSASGPQDVQTVRMRSTSALLDLSIQALRTSVPSEGWVLDHFRGPEELPALGQR